MGGVRAWGCVPVVAVCGLLLAGEAHADELLVDDPLTSAAGPPKAVNGGTFGPGGWTRDSFESQIVYDLGRNVTKGRVTFEMNGVNGDNHGVGGNPPCRAIFAALDEDGSGDLGVQNIWVWAMDNTVICNGEDVAPFRTNRMKLLVRTLIEPSPTEPMTDELDWNPATFHGYEVEWDRDHATLKRDGVQVLDQVYPSGQLSMNMRHLFLGTINRYDAGVGAATYRDLKVWDLGDDSPPECLLGVSVDPSDGAGESAVFRAAYSHCDGADAFRIVQIWFGQEVAIEVPHTGGSYENGRFAFGDTESCVPGEAKEIVTEHGTLDCSRSTATPNGNEMVVEWAVGFNVASFAGPRAIFFDAKGGVGDPEPRLGWTKMGSFLVEESASGTTTNDEGGSQDSATVGDEGSATSDTDSGGSGGSGGIPGPGLGRGGAGTGCGCGSAPGYAVHLWLLALFGLRRRPSGPR